MNVSQIKKKVTTIIILLFVSIQGISSQDLEYLYGKVVDVETGEPVIFANIHLKNRNMGVISNFDGGFRIPLSYRLLGDILVFSSMGYESEERIIDEFLKDSIVIVKLHPATFQLSEVDVSASKVSKAELSPEEIVSKSISLITSNYPIKPYSQIGYYRDYQKDKNEYINLNEAIIEVVDQGFKAIDSTTSKVIIYDYLKNEDFRRDTFALKPYDYNLREGGKVIDNAYLDSYGGNEFVILNVHNAIRNYKISSYSFIYILETDLLSEHSFKKIEDTFLDGVYLYTIEFTKKISNYTAIGKLYIDKNNFSIYKLEYVVYDNNSKNNLNIPDKNGSIKQIIFEVITEYRMKGNKMYLSFISLNNQFRVMVPPKFNVEFVDFNFNAERLEKEKVEYNGDSFVLTFNRDLNGIKTNNLWKKDILFKGQSIKINRAVIIGNQMVLYPALNKVKFKKFFEEFNAEKENFMRNLVEFNLPELRDIDDNKVGMWSTKYYNQFREYFIQEHNLNPRFIDSKLLMDKKKPIFENQSMSRPYDGKDYWMNTPFQNSVKY
ncbi:carboxypeptidase-like regulatory domain-containing protein [Maribacter litoralis]|uniref:Carboxypeptidase-like regulatory domain-containing protein n=1 Tax=Maribacter litoralis TaxID=2059726 RepID=A0A653U7G0_9FLAO|nr:carboxypeptidase-like regulatory domain-containing protein [Maribacter litoralis]VXB89723.1 Carboxypeptidase-like regulatory domain-containing protein [Maribacter litoralis]